MEDSNFVEDNYVVDGGMDQSYSDLVSSAGHKLFEPTCDAWYCVSVGVMVILIIIFVFLVIPYVNRSEQSGYKNGHSTQRFFSEVSGEDANRVEQMWKDREGFSNGRESPVYNNASNLVLQSENRKNDAIRALSTINRNRKKLASMERDVSPTEQLPWGPHWESWKGDHPHVGDGYENFDHGTGAYVNMAEDLPLI